MLNVNIAILINSFNRILLLQECIKALKWITTSSFKDHCIIIVFEAGSTDGSLQWLEQQRSQSSIPLKIIIAKEEADHSFAAGVNICAAYADKKYRHLKYLLIYETDNQLLSSEPLLQALEQLEKNKALGACGFTVKKLDGSPAGVGQAFPSLLNFALGKNVVQLLKLEAIKYKWKVNDKGIAFSEMDVVYTSPLLVKKNAWKTSGGFDAALFPFSDCDIDWAKRLRKAGWLMGVIRTDAVIHDNQNSISAWSASRAKQSHQGRLRYFKRHHPISIFIVWPLVLIIRHLFELTASLFVKNIYRKHQLEMQFLDLLKSAPKGYQ
ncbi:MAG: glycosyltransferase family 2 protein [Ilyomonas sp.]